MLTFDMVTVEVAITPILESFTIFFGLLGLWLTLAANKSYGFFVASSSVATRAMNALTPVTNPQRPNRTRKDTSAGS